MGNLMHKTSLESIFERRKKPDAILAILGGLALIIMSIVSELTREGWIGELFGIFTIVVLLYLVNSAINFIANKWLAAFNGTIYGKIVVKNNNTTIIPLKNIEISYNSPLLEKPGIPVFSDAEGRFRFERVVPVHKPITLEAKIGKDRLIYQHIGKIEGVKWFLGKPSLRLPLSSGVPKHVDFIVSTDKFVKGREVFSTQLERDFPMLSSKVYN